jgi:NAD(P)-dependent dehydrogenase (short-subunit alcohol dehydrogenase family)
MPTPDLTGTVCAVTGANRGIGLATATAFARAGAHVVLLCRDRDRADAAVHRVGVDRSEYLLVDLASQRSIRAAAAEFDRRHDRLDVLVNNAALVSEQRQLSEDGRELTFAVNHLAYYLLTRLLIGHLQAAPDGVVVNVAATNHRDAVDRVEDLDSVEGYEMRAAYKRSKLANVSFTLELARRLGTSGRANAFCPDVIATDLLMQFRRVPAQEWTERKSREASPDTPAGIATRLATQPGTGRYLEEGVDVSPSPLAEDRQLADRLWRRCAELVGVPPDWP